MKKKINARMVGIAVFSIVITAVAMAIIFYSRLETQVFNELEIIAEILSGETAMDKVPAEIRVSVINIDGTVQYDSAADAQIMENHLDRPEIQSALENGQGQGIRKSDTLSKSVFYYALRMEDGRILRVGKESVSVAWIFLSALPIVMLMVLVLVAVCMSVSHYFTASMVKPINEMAENMGQMDESKIYEELVPFTRKIRSQHEEILSAAKLRQEFTANISHELKTPLTAISGYAELMEAGVVESADIRHFSQEIHKSAGRLLNLINDILKLSRLDTADGSEFMEIVDIAALARDTVEMLSVNAARADVKLTCEGSETAKIHMGRELAEEICYNLIENAIRYNKKGGKVLVTVTENAQEVSFCVKDTGIGIAKEHQERIFERFYRVDKSRSKELGGTGLGLAIVKHICELTDGRLCLKSTPNVGTEIMVVWNACSH